MHKLDAKIPILPFMCLYTVQFFFEVVLQTFQSSNITAVHKGTYLQIHAVVVALRNYKCVKPQSY